jgi:hypothetical protein
VIVKARILAAAVAGACLAASIPLYASDFTGVYAVVDKVVFEPSERAPARVQVWGAFALSDGQRGSNYKPAEKGYMYFTCEAGKESICRKEWADFQSVAGKDVGVGFGYRYSATGRVRKASETPSSPDVYPIQAGVVRVEKKTPETIGNAETLKVIDGIRQALKQR